MKKKTHILFMCLAIISLLVIGCEREPPTSFDESIDGPLEGSKQFRENNPVSDQGGGVLRKDVTFVTTVFSTDFVSAGVGAMRNQAGPHTITLAGVSGTITQAVLYWHGPTNSADSTANANVVVNGTPVTGTNIGFSDNNCWGFVNSQAYAADVTALVLATGNGAYLLTGFGAGSINTNGASLVVYFNDADPTNNRDVVVFDGNDSNINNPFDAPGWNVTLSGINYTSGTANLQMHIADGQNFIDDALIINGSPKFPVSNWAGGFSVPGINNGPNGDGRLWDIINIDVTADLVAAVGPPQTLTMTTGVASDCLALVVALIDLPAGAAPEQPCEPVEDSDVRTQGFWKRVCGGPHPSGEHENLPDYVDFVNDFAIFADVTDVDDLCERLHPDPKNDKCEKAEAQFMALLLNLASGRVAVCNCVNDPDLGETTVGDVADFIDGLLSNPGRTFEDCVLAQAIADRINNGETLVNCP